VSFLSQQDIDAIGSQLYGLDAFMVLGLATLGFGVLGWLAGPVLGGGVFSIVRGGRGVRGQMAEVLCFVFYSLLGGVSL
jgi:import inner membrane translocase subunit TIM23